MATTACPEGSVTMNVSTANQGWQKGMFNKFLRQTPYLPALSLPQPLGLSEVSFHK